MNAKTYFAVSAFALLAATSSFAAEGTQDFASPVLSTKSRAEVVADLAAARNAGQIVSGEASSAPMATSTLLRERVAAEAAEAARLGLTGPSEALPQPTVAQLEQIRLAGERAVAHAVAALR